MTRVQVHLQDGDQTLLVGDAHFMRERHQLSTTFVYAPAYIAAALPAIDPLLPVTPGAQYVPFADTAPLGSAPHRQGRACGCARKSAHAEVARRC